MDELFLLYKLHQIDWNIYQIRQKANKLGVSPQIKQRYKEIQENTSPIFLRHQELQTTYKNITLKQQALEERKKSVEKEIYTQGATSRGIETFQKELQNIIIQSEENDTLLLQMLEELPEVEKKAIEAKKLFIEIEKQIKEQYDLTLKSKTILESEFEKLQQLRPQFAKRVPPILYNEYQHLLKKLNGIAMTEITLQKTCQMCGTDIAERLIENCKKGKKVQCESCKRILYSSTLSS